VTKCTVPRPPRNGVECFWEVSSSRVVSNPASYSRGPGFKSRPGVRISWLRSFPQSLQTNSTLNYPTTASFHRLSNSLFTNDSVIRSNIILSVVK
jgi:hypothetical protein